MAFEEDMSVFFDTDDFADSAVYTDGALVAPIDVIIDLNVEEPIDDVIERVNTATFPNRALRVGATLEVNGKTWEIGRTLSLSDDGAIVKVVIQ